MGNLPINFNFLIGKISGKVSVKNCNLKFLTTLRNSVRVKGKNHLLTTVYETSMLTSFCAQMQGSSTEMKLEMKKLL